MNYDGTMINKFPDDKINFRKNALFFNELRVITILSLNYDS